MSLCVTRLARGTSGVQPQHGDEALEADRHQCQSYGRFRLLHLARYDRRLLHFAEIAPDRCIGCKTRPQAEYFSACHEVRAPRDLTIHVQPWGTPALNTAHMAA